MRQLVTSSLGNSSKHLWMLTAALLLTCNSIAVADPNLAESQVLAKRPALCPEGQQLILVMRDEAKEVRDGLSGLELFLRTDHMNSSITSSMTKACFRVGYLSRLTFELKLHASETLRFQVSGEKIDDEKEVDGNPLLDLSDSLSRSVDLIGQSCAEKSLSDEKRNDLASTILQEAKRDADHLLETLRRSGCP